MNTKFHSDKVLQAESMFISAEASKGSWCFTAKWHRGGEAHSCCFTLRNRPEFHFSALVGIVIPPALLPEHTMTRVLMGSLQIHSIQVGFMAVIEPPGSFKGASTVI